jgi:cysteine desulfurase / selenocysteine lyase
VTDLSHLRSDFPILGREINGHPLVYLDSAATTQKPRAVIDAMTDYYERYNANVHRGAHTLSFEATAAYEHARSKVAALLATTAAQVVFTRGATSAINQVAYGWGLNHLTAGDRIVLSVSEHHANIVPWQLISRYTGAELVYLELDQDLVIDIADLDRVIDERVRIVAFTGMSNVTGAMGPIGPLVEAAAALMRSR